LLWQRWSSVVTSHVIEEPVVEVIFLAASWRRVATGNDMRVAEQSRNAHARSYSQVRPPWFDDEQTSRRQPELEVSRSRSTAQAIEPRDQADPIEIK